MSSQPAAFPRSDHDMTSAEIFITGSEDDEEDDDSVGSKRSRTKKPHLQGRFSGRMATKSDEKKLVDECKLLGSLLGGVGKRGDKSRLTLAKIVRGIAAGDIRRHCEGREQGLKVLQERLMAFEQAYIQLTPLKQENEALKAELCSAMGSILHNRQDSQQAVTDDGYRPQGQPYLPFHASRGPEVRRPAMLFHSHQGCDPYAGPGISSQHTQEASCEGIGLYGMAFNHNIAAILQTNTSDGLQQRQLWPEGNNNLEPAVATTKEAEQTCGTSEGYRFPMVPSSSSNEHLLDTHVQTWQVDKAFCPSTLCPPFFSSQDPRQVTKVLPVTSLLSQLNRNSQPDSSYFFKGVPPDSDTFSPYLQLSELDAVTSMMLGGGTSAGRKTALIPNEHGSSLLQVPGLKTITKQNSTPFEVGQRRVTDPGYNGIPPESPQQARLPCLVRHSMPITCAQQKTGAAADFYGLNSSDRGCA